MLSCQNLVFQRTQDSKKKVSNFVLETSLTLQSGERLAMTGPSGVGKTTLLLLLAGFLSPQKGEIIYKEKIITSTLPQERPFSFLFQENNLFDHLTVLENMSLAFQKRHPTNAQLLEIQTLLDHFQVGSFMKRYPHKLSGGQRRRVSLARCLLLKRPILLLDEPFTGVDHDTIQLMIQRLIETENLTLIFTSHHKSEIEALSTRSLALC